MQRPYYIQQVAKGVAKVFTTLGLYNALMKLTKKCVKLIKMKFDFSKFK